MPLPSLYLFSTQPSGADFGEVQGEGGPVQLLGRVRQLPRASEAPEVSPAHFHQDLSKITRDIVEGARSYLK